MNEKRRFIDRILRFIGIEEDELAATAEDDLQIPLQEYRPRLHLPQGRRPAKAPGRAEAARCGE